MNEGCKNLSTSVIGHAASVFERNKKDRFRAFGRKARSKSKRHSSSASRSVNYQRARLRFGEAIDSSAE